MKKYLMGSTLAAALLLVGCGSSSDTVVTESDTVDTVTTTTGYLVDSAVQNVDYDCITDNDLDKVTGIDGAFTCQNMSQVQFRIGNLVLGEIDALPHDGYVFPQDLAGVDREQGLMNEKVTAMAQFLQSLDEDGNVTNGIQIPEDVKDLLDEDVFVASDLDLYLESTSIAPAQIRTETQAQEHLRNTVQELLGTATQTGAAETGVPGNGLDLSLYFPSDLTDALKYTIAFMWNEEKLAKDIYLALNDIYPTQQLEKIATQAETKHQALVEELVQRYDLNITNLVDYSESYSEAELRAFEPGEFGIQEIKDLYDALYEKGKQSQQDALEVGCMVEVVDINDLNADIIIAKEANALDLVAVFNILRDGSYSHYWAFDKGLKNMGVTDGCCSLGQEYCHPEYPQNSNGNK